MSLIGRCICTARILVPLLLTACASSTPAPGGRLHLALAPAQFVGSMTLQQQVHVEMSGRTAEFDAVLDISPEAVTLVALTLGQRIFTLRYDGTQLEESRSSMLPRDVRARDILSDVQLALWPEAAIRAVLPAGWTVQDETDRRTLSHESHAVTTITYNGVPRWAGRITLRNLQDGYMLDILSSRVDP